MSLIFLRTAETPSARLLELRRHQVYRLERQPQRSLLKRLRRTLRAQFSR